MPGASIRASTRSSPNAVTLRKNPEAVPANRGVSMSITSSESPVTIAALKQMKREGRKIVGVVGWDYQIAQIADRAGVDLVSVGDSVGVNLWGHATETEVTIEELLVVCKAVRRGVKRALVSCDIPSAAQAGVKAAVLAAGRLVEEGGADMVKIFGAPDTVSAIVRAGVPVFAEFHGGDQVRTTKLVEQAKQLEEAGAALL